MKIGDGTEQGVAQGPLINMKSVEKIECHIAGAGKRGGKIVTGGKRPALGGTLFEPTVLANLKSDAIVAQASTLPCVPSTYRPPSFIAAASRVR